MESEIWKPVPSKPGLMASRLGRIQFPARKAKMPNGGERKYNTRPIWGVVTRAGKGARHAYRGGVQ